MKLTKKSYNRRMFALGALLFLSIGLVSTGFAAFVMSKGAQANIDGNIQVGTITDGSVKIENVAFKDGNDKILFEAAKDDNDGEVKWDVTTPTVYENLSVTLTAEISPVTYVKDLKRHTIHLQHLHSHSTFSPCISFGKNLFFHFEAVRYVFQILHILFCR